MSKDHWLAIDDTLDLRMRELLSQRGDDAELECIWAIRLALVDFYNEESAYGADS